MHALRSQLVEMLRRFLLVGLMVTVESGTTLQVILGTLFSMIFLLFQVQAAPFKRLSDDYLAGACSFSLSSIFCLLSKVVI